MGEDEKEELVNKIISLLEEQEGVGALIVLGRRVPYLMTTDVEDPEKLHDYFYGKDVNVFNGKIRKSLYECLTNNKYNDGSIEVHPETGDIIQGDGRLDIDLKRDLRGLRRRYFEERGIVVSPGARYSKQLLFAEDVGLRHLTAKCYSFETGQVVITLSQETGCIRVFEKGRIVYSDIDSEIEPIPGSSRRDYHHTRPKRDLEKRVS